MTLTPPARICGPLPHYTDAALRAERRAWIATVPDSVPSTEIAAALGISDACAGVLRRKAGFTRRKRKRLDVSSRGLRVGVLGAAILDMPDEAQAALEARAARRGLTLAEALASAFAEGVAA